MKEVINEHHVVLQSNDVILSGISLGVNKDNRNLTFSFTERRADHHTILTKLWVFNDNRKFQACFEHNISLCIIDTSQQKHFTEQSSYKYLEIITNIINSVADARIELAFRE